MRLRLSQALGVMVRGINVDEDTVYDTVISSTAPYKGCLALLCAITVLASYYAFIKVGPCSRSLSIVIRSRANTATSCCVLEQPLERAAHYLKSNRKVLTGHP